MNIRLLFIFQISSNSAQLDGINIQLVASQKNNVIDFVEAMRSFMKPNATTNTTNTTNTTKEYFLTISPDCYTLDIPAAFVYDAITKATNQFDSFFVDFGHSNCYMTSKDFVQYFNRWDKLLEPVKVDFYLTLSASDQGPQRNFIQPADVQDGLRRVRYFPPSLLPK